MNPQNVDVVWEFKAPDEKAVARLVRNLGLRDPIARVLVNRGITDVDEAKSFLNPTLKDLESSETLTDMDVAVRRIHESLKRDETIAIYGDYDVDGVTSTALLANFLTDLGGKVITYTPNRVTEGYGLNGAALEKLKAQGAALTVTVDLGIADSEAIKVGRAAGMDVVVVDHHQAPDVLPDAVAVVDPFRKGEGEFYKGLSAAGLTFYLITAFRSYLRDNGGFKDSKEPNLRAILDLVTLGTIGDLAPLLGPNRIITYFGLQELGAERRPGIAALKKAAGMARKEVTAGQVAFQLAPRINAAGRMGSADKAVRLLTTQDPDEARKIAFELNDINKKRQEIESRILAQAFENIEKNRLHEGSAVVVGGHDWHPGVIGIVASKITEAYGLPAVVVALGGESSKGSARSVRGLHMYRAMKDCSELLVGFGGHEMAAGIVIKESNLDAFRERFEQVVKIAEPPLRQSVLHIDAELELEDLDGILAEALGTLHPHGMANPEPLFFADNVRAIDPRKVGTNHLKFRVQASEGPIEAIAFDKADLLDLAKNEPIDLAYTPRLSTWEGWKRLEIKIRQLRPSN